jgi:hypothetical protein
MARLSDFPPMVSLKHACLPPLVSDEASRDERTRSWPFQLPHSVQWGGFFLLLPIQPFAWLAPDYYGLC